VIVMSNELSVAQYTILKIIELNGGKITEGEEE